MSEYNAGPATSADEFTPSDTAVISPTRGIYVGGAGDLEVVMLNGQTVVFSSVPAGSLLPLCVKQVLANNTTATSIVVLN